MKLANKLIKKALVDQDSSAGKEALIINEKDVLKYEKMQKDRVVGGVQ